VENFVPQRRTDTSLARLHELERRYDGPVPEAALAALEATPAELDRRRAAADGGVIDLLAREAVQALAHARRRLDGEPRRRLDGHPAAARLVGCRAAGLALRPAR
jgi:hypothetical protein